MLTELDYSNILSFCKSRAFTKNVSDIYAYTDLAHDVICEEDFGVENYKPIVDRKIYQKLAEKRIKKVAVSEYLNPEKFEVEEIWNCKNCSVELPKSKFQKSWQVCNKCYYQENKDRIKAANKKSYLKHREKRLAEKRVLSKKYRQENLEEVRRKDRERYHRNKSKKKKQ